MLNIKVDKTIEESEERFRSIIENALDIITLIDAEGTIVYNSPAFARQLGYEPWEVLGQSLFDFIHEDDRADVMRRFKRLVTAVDAPEGDPVDFRFRHKDGRWRTFEAVVSNLLKNEVVQAVVLNSRDVTEHREFEEELEKYRSHLEDLVERRTSELRLALETEKKIVEQQMTFISMVSHEFRTPLTIIDGNAQIIQKRGGSMAPDMLATRSGTIRTAVERLVRLIETILSAHVLESGRLTINLAPAHLGNIVREACAEQLDISAHHTIKADIQDEFPEIKLDERVIRQVMTNLISNAIKYAPNNPLVEVTVSREDQMAMIEVVDHGVGIPEDELPKVATRYFRASTSGGIPGSGLGLSLVKQFIELHHGTVDIQSKLGVGTKVIVRLPIQ